MYILYIDESGTTDIKHDDKRSSNGDDQSLFFVLGAALIHARQLEKIEVDFTSLIKKKYFIDELTELKYSMGAKYLKQGKRVDHYRQSTYDLIARSDLTLFGAQVNKFRMHENGCIQNPDDTYLLAFQHLVSAINGHMFTSKVSDPIVVIIDSIDRKHDRKVFKAYRQALLNEELFPNFDKSIFSPSINFGVSEFTIGLQISDMVAGALWRGLELEKKDFSITIKGRFPSSDSGNPLGYGYINCDKWLIK